MHTKDNIRASALEILTHYFRSVQPDMKDYRDCRATVRLSQPYFRVSRLSILRPKNGAHRVDAPPHEDIV